MWDLRGNEYQQSLVQEAIDACDFPFNVMAPSLEREGKDSIAVDWEDLSRYAVSADRTVGEHDHFHDGDAEASPIERELDGRMRVLGLFYLPPYTRVVLDSGLVAWPSIAREVFLAEGAHAVDYHYLTNEQRVAIWNALHADHQDLAADTVVPESGDIGHGHSWFDGAAGYSSWVGEALMEGFTRAFAPSVAVTIELDHPTSPEAAQQIREAMLAPLVFAGPTKVVHDSHRGITPTRWFASVEQAVSEGMRPCGVCKP